MKIFSHLLQIKVCRHQFENCWIFPDDRDMCEDQIMSDTVPTYTQAAAGQLASDRGESTGSDCGARVAGQLELSTPGTLSRLQSVLGPTLGWSPTGRG